MFKTASSCQGGDSSATAAAPPPRPSRSPLAQMPEVLLKEGASTAGSNHVQSDGQSEAGSDRTSQRRESTGKEAKITSAGTAPSTSKPHCVLVLRATPVWLARLLNCVCAEITEIQINHDKISTPKLEIMSILGSKLYYNAVG